MENHVSKQCDPDQIPHYVTSDPGLIYLLMKSKNLKKVWGQWGADMAQIIPGPLHDFLFTVLDGVIF